MFTNKLKIKSLLPFLALSLLLSFGSCDNATDKGSDEMELDGTADVNSEGSSMSDKNSQTSQKARNTKKIYTVTEVDRQPIFGLECPVDENPVECSNREMLEFIKSNAEFPKAARLKNQDGFEQVVVVIEKDGSLSDLKYVASSKSKDCEGCQKAAVDVVGKMTNWTPGMKNGKPVAVQMTIPVRFESQPI